MPLGIEILSDDIERFHAALAQHVEQLPVDQLESLPVAIECGVAAGLGAQRAFEVVDYRKQVLDQIGGNRFGQSSPFAIGPLAIVVEFRAGSEQAIVRARPAPAGARTPCRRRFPSLAMRRAWSCPRRNR